MSETNLVEQLAADITSKLDGIRAEIPSDSAIQAKVEEFLNGFLDSDEGKDFARKLTFASESDPKLKGSKYARLGLSAADVEWMHNVLSESHAAGISKAGPSEDLQNAFAAVSKGEYVSAQTAAMRDAEAIDRFYDGLPNTPQNRARRESAIQAAMDTAEAGYGQQLIGAGYVGELWEAPRKLGRVAPLINTFPMQHPTEYLPIEADLPEMLFVAENTADNSSEYGTSASGSRRVQVDAKKFVIHQIYSGEMEEDSIIPYIPFLRGQSAKSLAHYLDSLVLNGDNTNAATGNINLDDADPADTKHYLAYDGIRHAGLVDNTNNTKDLAGPITYGALVAARGRMVDTTYLIDWGHPIDPSDLIYVCDPFTADKIALLDEVLTVDKYGAGATVLNGELARIGMNPLVSSIAVPLTEADGKASTTASNNVKGQVVTFNRNGFVLGWRRQVQVEVERLPGRDQSRIIYSLRNGFGRFAPSGSASSIEAADVIYDIAL